MKCQYIIVALQWWAAYMRWCHSFPCVLLGIAQTSCLSSC